MKRQVYFSSYILFLTLLLLSPTGIFAQGMSVLGGSDKAKECFMNAELSGTLEFVARLAAPCDYSLNHVTLSVSDKAATYANRGIIRSNGNDFDGALEDFARALVIRPEMAEIYINRGNAFFHRGDFEQAIRDYTMALELNLDAIHIAYLDRGMAYERISNNRMAEADYRLALEHVPQWVLAQNKLRDLLMKQELDGN